ncbi:hypothetical protein Pla123a_38530 [Posidoniimonas polymericola]|uniref:DUF4154 domain-containing protein n=1 Tax=Posidoniimonas polymericola TaxID=2528002 RepID=A0A5C5YCS3_9BACT|nr:YfiR family protein [Posidoniimonas polymericola]TWT73517.1 hypothetical protein Pla123a_38530 [Posidoniimonas polymericola]
MELTAHASKNTHQKCRAGSVRIGACLRPLVGSVLVAAVVLGGAERATAQATAPAVVINREYTIKAAFLYHFLTYTEWPSSADANGPLVVGVYKSDPFGEVLDKIAATKKVNNRSIEVRRISDPAESLHCHLLFVPDTVTADGLAPLFAAVSEQPVMLVGETEGFVDRGGAAEFYLEGNRVRFAFNMDVVDEKNLKVSSKLLSLAKIVTAGQASK